MRLHPISSYLERFDSGIQEPDQENSPDSTQSPPFVETSDCETLQPDDFPLTPTAEDRGTDCPDHRNVDPDAFANHVALERARWTEEESERLAVMLKSSLNQVTVELCDSIQGVMAPFVRRHIIDQLLDDCVSTIGALVANRYCPAIKISGPGDLLRVLGQKLELQNIVFQMSECDQIEISTSIDSTTLVTRLQEWLHRIDEIGVS